MGKLQLLGYIAFGGYLVVSFVLLKHPYLLHKKKKLRFKCSHISHRGGAFERLENTIEAFRHAVEDCSTDMLELDVQLTRDGQVVVAHDDNLLRLTGHNVNISQLSYPELPPLRELLEVEFLEGLLCMDQLIEDRRIPLLRELFERFPSMPMYIDLKQNNDELILKVQDLIAKYDRQEITVWGNISNEITLKCREADPSIQTFFSASRVVWLVLAAWTGLLPFITIKESCLSVFHPEAHQRNPSFREAAAYNPLYWYFLRAVDLLLMRRFIFEHLRKRGLQVHLWVINDRRTFDRCFELGVDGIITDCPTLLRAYISEHPYVVSEK